jgi:hypothetical protein
VIYRSLCDDSGAARMALEGAGKAPFSEHSAIVWA